MKWRVRIGDAEHRVEIPLSSDGTPIRQGEALVDGRAVQFDAIDADQGAISLLVNGKSYTIDYERRGEKTALLLGGQQQRSVPFTVGDERASSASGSRKASEGPISVIAPMPGKIVRVLAKPGDEVKADQGLIVVEAMKMENELRAPRAGQISQVLVREGAAVEGGATLCVLD
jgi:biotin carboxyl carrier protein